MKVSQTALTKNSGFVHFFRPKIEGLFKAFQGHIFPFFKDSKTGVSSLTSVVQFDLGQSRSQRLRPFWSAPRIRTSGRIQKRTPLIGW